MRFLCQGRREVPDGRGENACESGRAGEPEQTSAGKREMFHADLLFFRVLTGRDFFHPCHAFAVFALTDGEVRHGAAGAAPCQCFTFGRQMTTSPWCMVLIGPPHSWVRPVPKVTISVWPRGWVCQSVRAPGSKVT